MSTLFPYIPGAKLREYGSTTEIEPCQHKYCGSSSRLRLVLPDRLKRTCQPGHVAYRK